MEAPAHIKLNLHPDEIELLNALKTVLVSRFGEKINKIVLFGSKARGDAEPHSDLDVAIIVRGLDRKLKREVLTAVAEVEVEYLRVIGAIVFSTDEFQHLLNRERRIALDIVNEGIVL